MPKLLTEGRRAAGVWCGPVRSRGLVAALAVLLPLVAWLPAASGAGNADAVAQVEADNIPAAELRSFARAARAVFQIRQAYASKVQAARGEVEASTHVATAQKEMEAAIREEGMTVERYNEILMAAQHNTVLAGRIQMLIDKAAQGK